MSTNINTNISNEINKDIDVNKQINTIETLKDFNNVILNGGDVSIIIDNYNKKFDKIETFKNACIGPNIEILKFLYKTQKYKDIFIALKTCISNYNYNSFNYLLENHSSLEYSNILTKYAINKDSNLILSNYLLNKRIQQQLTPDTLDNLKEHILTYSKERRYDDDYSEIINNFNQVNNDLNLLINIRIDKLSI